MIRVNFDDSKLPIEGRAFLKKWTDSLGVTHAELLGRILIAAVEGEHYIEKMPTKVKPPHQVRRDMKQGRC